MKEARLPTIFVFDLDETMIGVSNHVSTAVDLYEFIHNGISLRKIPFSGKKKAFVKSHGDFAAPNILRPHFKEGMEAIKRHYPTAEFFVYSAGTFDYVISFVKWIERLTGITFRRPIFARHNTMSSETSSYVKSIEYHAPAMMDVLEADYPALSKLENRKQVTDYRMIHIDDRANILWEGPQKLINCPGYDFEQFFDITEGIDKALISHPSVQEYLKNQTRYNKSNPYVIPENATEDKGKAHYHLAMFEIYNSLVEKNAKALQDDFFVRFPKALSRFKSLKRPFTSANVKKINDELSNSKKS